MLVYPILNFVLPLMLSSFVLVEKPATCSDCQIKKEHSVLEKTKIEVIQGIDAKISSLKSSSVTDGEIIDSKMLKETD